jgi:hypothetical protein
MKYSIKNLALYLFKIIKFFNFILYKITKKDFLSHLMLFLREASYTTIRICDKNIIFFTPNLTTNSRVNTFFTKEPETLEWIDNFKTGKKIIFWDIGGNDGIEHLILRGADKYLKNLNIKSLSIEINENFTLQFKGVLNIMRANGFKILHKKHSEKMFKHSKTYNYVFIR